MSRIDWFRATLEGAASTEGRAAVSIVLVVFALAVSFLLAPRISRWIGRRIETRIAPDASDSFLAQLDDLVGWTVSVRGVVRTFQVVIAVATGFLLLIVWGYLDWALLIVDVLVAAWPYAVRVLLTFLLVAAGVVGSRFIERKIQKWAAETAHITQHQEGVAFRILQISIFVAVGMGALSLWEIDLSGLLIGAGFLGIVLGMAARQTLGSLVAGLVLMFSRPFEIGDWVSLADNEGIVLDITIINTRIRNFDGEIVVLPNDRVANATIVNRSKQNRLRVRVDVGVDYETDVETAQEIALEAIRSIDDVAQAPKPQVIPKEFGDSAVVLECRFWIERPNARKKWRTRAAVIRAIKDAFEREGIKIPFPQRELTGRAETGGFRTTTGTPREQERETTVSDTGN